MGRVPKATVLDVFEDAIGATPAGIVARGRPLTSSDLASIESSRSRNWEPLSNSTSFRDGIWPLVSHHHSNSRGLFLSAHAGGILSRALTLLLVHDGLVVADPLDTVLEALRNSNETKALHLLNRTVEELAVVEPLIAARVLRLTQLRPPLRETHRESVLRSLGVGSDLRVFTDFIEAAGAVPDLPGSLERLFAPQVRDLYQRFGLQIDLPRTLLQATKRVMQLASAVIEVSWQFSVASIDPTCDLALRGRIELHLAERLVHEGLPGKIGEGRHLQTLALGRVPNVDVTQLTSADALAMRDEDSFVVFRNAVRIAIDNLESARQAGVPETHAAAAFEQAMREESRKLRETAKRSTFHERLRDDFAVPAALGVIAVPTASQWGDLATAGAAVAVPLTTVMWHWLMGRRENSQNEVAFRYLCMLGGR